MVDGGVQGGHVLQDGQDVPAGLHHPAEVQRLQARRAQASQPLHTAGKHPLGSLGAFWGSPSPAQPSWEGQCSHLALGSRRGHFAEALLLARVRGVLRQLVQDVGAGRVGDVQVVGQGCPVGCGAGEGMLLVGFLWRSGERKKNEKPSNLMLLC